MALNRCLGCMAQITAYPCPHCGHNPISMANPDFTLRQGTLLGGKYVVGKVLGQGGFGITYVGWDLTLERKIAIKEYFPSGQVSRHPSTGSTLIWFETEQARYSRRDGMEVFLREARKMSKVDTIPHVVRVRDVFMENETAYIVMDFIEGETLKKRLQRTGPMDWETARPIFLSATQAMAQVHNAGIIHRDLSPDNLMIAPDGSVMILDLGAAKDLNVHSGASSMQVAKGGFSPLEQYTQRGGSGTWTDVYALAATIYYTLTGVLPPAAIDRAEDDTLRWDLPRLRALPGSVTTALKKALSVRAKDRTQTMAELLRQLSAEKKQGLFGRRGKEAKKKEEAPPPQSAARKPKPPKAKTPKPVREATPAPEKGIPPSEPERKELPKPPKPEEPRKTKEPKPKRELPPAPEPAKESEKETGKKRLPLALLIGAVLVLAVCAALLPGKPGSEKADQMNAPTEAASPATTEATVETHPTQPATEPTATAPMPDLGPRVFLRRVEEDGKFHLRTNTLDVCYDEATRVCRVTLTGLGLQPSYPTNLPDSQKNVLEYGWEVTFMGDFGDTIEYRVTTMSWAFNPGEIAEKTLDDMETRLWKLEPSSSSYNFLDFLPILTHTSDTLCWEFSVPRGSSFDLSRVICIRIDICAPEEHRSDIYLPAAEDSVSASTPSPGAQPSSATSPPLTRGSEAFTMQTVGSVTTVDTDNLTVRMTDDGLCTVTLSGLTLEDSYITDKNSTRDNAMEYFWCVTFTGPGWSYDVSTSWASFGGEVCRLDDMAHAVWKHEGNSNSVIAEAQMTHTDDSITWIFTLPEDFSQATEITASINPYSDNVVTRTYTRAPAA